jgi:hypothetical protein
MAVRQPDAKREILGLDVTGPRTAPGELAFPPTRSGRIWYVKHCLDRRGVRCAFRARGGRRVADSDGHCPHRCRRALCPLYRHETVKDSPCAA